MSAAVRRRIMPQLKSLLALALLVLSAACTGAGDEGPTVSRSWIEGDHSLIATAYSDEVSTEVVLESAGPDYYDIVTVVDGTADGDLDLLVGRIDNRVRERAVDDLADMIETGSTDELALIEAIGAALDVDPGELAMPYGDLSHDPAGASNDGAIEREYGAIGRPAGELSRDPAGASGGGSVERDPGAIGRPAGEVSTNPTGAGTSQRPGQACPPNVACVPRTPPMPTEPASRYPL